MLDKGISIYIFKSKMAGIKDDNLQPSENSPAIEENKNEKKEKPSTVLSFFVFGLMLYFTFTVTISGAQDIMAASNIQTSMNLIAHMVPIVLITVVFPYFIREIPYLIRVFVVSVTNAVGFVIVAYVKQAEWKLFGISLASVGFGFGNMSIIALTSYFETSALAAYSAGTGAGFLVAPFYYTAMTTWGCISPSITLVLVAPLCTLFQVSYYFISKNQTDQTNYKGYQQVQTTDTDDEQTDENQQKVPQTEYSDSLSRKEKMSIILKMLSLTFVPVYTTFVSYFTLIQSVTTTIAYKNSPFRPRDHYQYYIFIFMFGELVGRSHRSVISFFNPRWLYVPTCTQLWVLSVLVFLHFLFAVFESWYRFLTGVTTILMTCLSAGILGGFLFSIFPEILRLRLTIREREFGMGYALSPASTGILSAGIVGLFVEPKLLEHCTSTVLDTAYCFTRPESFKDIISHCGTTLP